MNTSRIYTCCGELPLYNFVKIVVTNNLSWLNIDRMSEEQPLPVHTDQWEVISHEYSSLTNNVNQTHTLMLLKEIATLNIKLIATASAVDFLRSTYDEDIAKELKALVPFKCTYDPSSESYNKNLDLTLSAAKTFLLKRDDAEKELGDLRKANGEKKATEQDYVSQIVILSKFMGHWIDWKTISVADYIGILNTYNKQSERGG